MKHAVKITMLLGLLSLAAPIATGASELQIEDPSLVEAVRKGDVDKVRMLVHILGDKVRLSETRVLDGEQKQFSLLQLAVENDDIDMATLLLEFWIDDLDMLLDGGETALGSAQSENMVNLLVGHGANVNGKKGENGRIMSCQPPLSAQIGNKAFKALLDKGASWDQPNRHLEAYPLEALVNHAQWTKLDILLRHPRADQEGILPPLHRIAYKGSESEITDELNLALDDNTNEQDQPLRMTPLHWAVLGNNIQTATCLLRNNAKPDIRDTLDRAPLYYAIVRKNDAMITLLLEHGASQILNAKVWFYGEEIATAAHVAARHGNLAFLSRVLASRDNAISSTPEPGVRTPLHWAVGQSHDAVVRLLLDAGACVNSRGPRGEVPLHCASTRTITHLLLQNGADVNHQTDDGVTPLHTVTHPAAINLLLQRGANANLQTIAGNTPLHCCAGNIYNQGLTYGLKKARQLLGNREADCDLEIKNQAGETPFTCTIALLGRIHQEQWRLEEGWKKRRIIVVDQPNSQSEESRIEAMAHLLVSRGANIRKIPAMDPSSSDFSRKLSSALAPLYDELKQTTYLERMLALQEYFHGLQETEEVPLDVSRTIAGMLHTPEEIKLMFPTR